MKKVVLRAPVLSQSGYGVHSRQIARWLLQRNDVDLTIQPVQWGMTPWLLNGDLKDGLIEKLIEKSKDDKGPFDVSFQVQLPNEWTKGLAKVDVAVTAGVETTICNPDWIRSVNQFQHVLVPSKFVKTTFERSGEISDSTQVHVIPESFIDSVERETSIDLTFETKFNFLMVSQMTSRNADSDRKNIFNTVKWFCETFENDSDVGLIIKTNNGRESKIDRKITFDIMRQLVSQVRKTSFPRVHLLHGTFSDDEMAALYKHPQIKAFISLTRGEGFGLPILEAAACDLPVIATNWSGHLDFMNHGKFMKVDFELKQIPTTRVDKAIFMPEAKWADVTESDVKRKLSKFRDRSEIPTTWAKELGQLIRKKYSFDAVLNQYDDLWNKLGL